MTVKELQDKLTNCSPDTKVTISTNYKETDISEIEISSEKQITISGEDKTYFTDMLAIFFSGMAIAFCIAAFLI